MSMRPATAFGDVLTELMGPEKTPVGTGSPTVMLLPLGSTRTDDGDGVGAGSPVV
jgi:hypothetical protein